MSASKSPFSVLLGRVRVHRVPRRGLVGACGLSLLCGATLPSSALSPLTGLPVPFGPFGTHTWLHFLGYATLGSVATAAVLAREGTDRGFVLPFGCVATYGLAIEVLHAVLPYRTFSGLDIATNLFGAFVGCALVWTWYNLAQRHLHGRLYASPDRR